MDKMLSQLKQTALKAGAVIKEIYYSKDFEVELKADNSPLTRADRASHETIVNDLEQFFPEIPLLSEEGELPAYQKRAPWKSFFLIDPLDGTKSFIQRDGDFTVNIAYMENNIPKIGVVYAPARDWLYFTDGQTAWKEVNGQIAALPDPANQHSALTAVCSKNHARPEDKAFMKKYGVKDTVSMGSSLKFCLVAEGKADLYFRSGPTMEWDTAAAHAVIRGCGGHVLNREEELVYNKPDLHNPSFLCLLDKKLIS